MKRILCILIGTATTNARCADIVQLNSGKIIECAILQATNSHLTVELRDSANTIPIQRSLSLSDVKGVSLSDMNAGIRHAPLNKLNHEELMRIWSALHPLISKPGNRIAAVGLKVASEQISSNGGYGTIQNALDILRHVKSRAVDSKDRIHATVLEMESLTLLGRFSEALNESKKWEGPDVPLVLRARAKLTVGLCGHEEMRLFLVENPRWKDDVRVHPDRAEIYNRTLDAYMFAALFALGSDKTAETAVLRAVRFLMLCEEHSEAQTLARTFNRRFPDSTYAKQIEYEASHPIPRSRVSTPANISVPPCDP